MRKRTMSLLMAVLLLPATAFAQASIVGVIRDASGAVLPGVTVEAASPVLIEKVRSTITDGNGRYQLVDLRPGDYTVTFSLAGFNSLRREGVTLSGSATASIDAELSVGTLDETITVTGAAPIVDVQTQTRQATFGADTLDALPTARNHLTLARLIPGTVGGGDDVGGSQTAGTNGSVSIHGSRTQDQRVTLNGISVMTLQSGGGAGGQATDMGSAAEVTVDHTAVSAELPTGGVRINFIPRDGGNTFKNSTFFTFSNGALQGSNFSDELKNAGLATPSEIQHNYDLNVSGGGPIRRDSVWFWASVRRNVAKTYVPVFANKNAWNPNAWLYEPDTSQRGEFNGDAKQSSIRVTWQASPRNKIAGTYKADGWCQCPWGVSATRAPEAAADWRFPRLRQEHLEWTSPVTNRLLLEAVGMHLYEFWGWVEPWGNDRTFSDPAIAAIGAQMIPVTEQSTGMIYRGFTNFNNTLVPNFAYRAAMSYVTGTHNFKVGFNRTHGFLDVRTYSTNPLSYRFLNGTPNQVTMLATPYRAISNQDNDLGFYAQDRWTMDRMTLNLAIRLDVFQTSFPEQRVGPSQFTPARDITFPASDNLDWKDLTYRTGMTYDLFGNKRTALTLTANRYLRGQTINGLGTTPNPVNALVNTANRAWDDRNRNFVPDCDLLDPVANGECDRIDNPAFGTAAPGATFDEDLLAGFGHREANWEFSAGVQHEVLPRVSVDVAYYRRIWQNFQVTDNLAFSPEDYDRFSLTVPVDSRLPNGGGYTLTGLMDLKPSAFGRRAQNFNALSSDYGEQIEHWNGVDVSLNARLANGLTLQVGSSTGRTAWNDCEVASRLPETLTVATATPGQPTVVAFQPQDFCDRKTPWLTSLKGYAVYTVPKADVQVSGTFRSTQEVSINANFVATNAYLAANSTLGRPLSGGRTNMTVNIIAPSSKYLDRRNELDLRIGKILRFGRSRSVASVDIFNALNNDAILTANPNFASWLRPVSILNARVLKFSMQFDF